MRSEQGVPLIGRDREMGELGRALGRAVAGRGHLVLVSGEPGIGKSRLLDELTAQARQHQVTPVTGRCWEAGGAPPYWPWVQALRTYVRDRSAEEVRAEVGAGGRLVAQLIPEVQEHVADVAEPALGGDPEAARFRLFDSVATFLINASRARPLLVGLEDVHAADEPSLLLLRFLSAVISDIPLLVIATFRDTELEGARLALLTEIARQPAASEIALGGLSEDDVRRFVRATENVAPPAGLAPLLFAQTDGNPLFIGEIVRLLAQQGRLDRLPDSVSWRLTLPAGIEAVVLTRLSYLSQSGRSLLTVACVLGREFDLAVLERVSGLERADVVAAVDEAISARLVTEIPGMLGRFRFGHVLIREALYKQLSVGERSRLHERAGLALEEVHRHDLLPHLSEIAHHLFEAAPAAGVERGIDYARRAAAHAATLLAYEEAIRFYAMAVRLSEMADHRDERLRCELLLGMGESQARAGDASAAKASFLDAAAMARRIGLPESLARAALGYGGRFVWEAARGDAHLRPLLEEALEALGSEENDLAARVMVRLAAGPLRDTPDTATRDELSRRAVDLARRLGDPMTLAYTLAGRYAATWWPENLEERVELARELIAAARLAGDMERELQGHHYLFLARFEQGDRAGAERNLRAQVDLANQLRQPAYSFYDATVKAMMATFEGRYGRSEQLIAEAFELGSRAERSMAEIYRSLQLYALRKDQGRAGEAEEQLEEKARAFPTYFALSCALADIFVSVGKGRRARDLLDRFAADAYGRLPPNDEWLFSVCLLAEVAARLRDVDRARELYELLEPYAGRVALSAPDVCVGAVSFFLGSLAVVLERFDVAESHLERAIELNSRMGGRPWEARAKHALARALLAGGRPEARELALPLVQQAFNTASELNMRALELEASDLMRDVGVAPASSRRVRTFLFTDVVRSSELVSAIGDDAWVDVVRWHDQALRDLFETHSGEEVDHAGDGFFVAFDDPSSAIECAVAIQRRLREHRREHGFAPQVRIGLHQADAMGVAGDYKGKGVHEAARIGALAAGGEILTSRATVEGASVQQRVSAAREAVLRGIGPVEIVAVEWE